MKPNQCSRTWRGSTKRTVADRLEAGRAGISVDQKMKLTLPTRDKALRLIAGWCALLLYVGVFSPVGVALAELVGKCDPNHQALVQVSAGGTKVLLHHQPKDATHHHGLLARTLTTFAAPTHPGEPDHILQFGAADVIPGKAFRAAAPAIQLHQTCPATLKRLTPSPLEVSLSRAPTQPLSPQHGQLLCLRSTLLLI